MEEQIQMRRKRNLPPWEEITETPKESVSELLRQLMELGAFKSILDSPLPEEFQEPPRQKRRRMADVW